MSLKLLTLYDFYIYPLKKNKEMKSNFVYIFFAHTDDDDDDVSASTNIPHNSEPSLLVSPIWYDDTKFDDDSFS